MKFKILIGVLAVIILFVLGFAVREYWRSFNDTQTYDACVQNFGSTEVAPGIHRCKVPFLDREFFFDESTV